MGAITRMTKRFLTHWLPYTHSWLTWCLKQLYNNRCTLHIKMTFLKLRSIDSSPIWKYAWRCPNVIFICSVHLLLLYLVVQHVTSVFLGGHITCFMGYKIWHKEVEKTCVYTHKKLYYALVYFWQLWLS